MWKVKNLKIVDLWGELDYDIDFNLKLNIFIGDNGVGKTTILKIINSALKIDPTFFRELIFDSIKLLLINDHGQQRTLRIEKEHDGIHFYLSNKAIFQAEDTEDYVFSNKGKRGQIIEQNLRRRIRKQFGMPSILWLPTNRISFEEELIGSEALYANQAKTIYDVVDITNPIDLKLRNLIEKVDEEIAKNNQAIVNEDIIFRNNMVNRNFQALNSSDNDDLSTERFTTALKILKDSYATKRIFSKLKSISDKIPSSRLELTAIDSIRRKLKQSNNDVIGYTVDDVMKISAFSFLIQYVEDYDKYQEKIEEINKPMKALENNFNNVFSKKFCIDTKNKCSFWKKNSFEKESFGHENFEKESFQYKNFEKKLFGYKEFGKEPFEYSNFSSGEKQMLIFILECSLYLNSQCLYLTDEPEISLHLRWQKMYLDILVSTNFGNQFFVATHSPDIIGKYRDNVVNINQLLR